ncbi:DUF4177 domain-containing protein [Dickeya undicola]|uniref:DUF4177 domain-containing protein n=1 Tax=Dickeya undicola TaxID=1577887 RepID=UPI003F27A151
MYKYKMVQIPPNIIVNARKVDKDNAAAHYLEQVVNEKAGEGWEFQRIDTIGVEEQPGCASLLFGKKNGPVNYYVITFRKEA